MAEAYGIQSVIRPSLLLWGPIYSKLSTPSLVGLYILPDSFKIDISSWILMGWRLSSVSGFSLWAESGLECFGELDEEDRHAWLDRSGADQRDGDGGYDAWGQIHLPRYLLDEPSHIDAWSADPYWKSPERLVVGRSVIKAKGVAEAKLLAVVEMV